MTIEWDNGPQTRIGRLSAATMAAFSDHSDYQEGDQAILIVRGADHRQGGLSMHDYGPGEALEDLLAVCTVLAEENGQHLFITPIQRT